MTTFEIKNTIQEAEDKVVLFVNFIDGDNIYEETFRFPLNKKVQDILAAIQSKATEYDERKITMEENYRKLQEDLLAETNQE
jgi:hypothetical protein